MSKRSLGSYKIAVILLVIFSNSYGNYLDVEFSGILQNTSCQVTAESLNQRVQLDNLRRQYINANTLSEVTPFFISIEKCNQTDLHKMIKITWQSQKLVEFGGVSYMETAGSSKALLQLVDKQGKPINWLQPITLETVSVVGGEQQLEFGVLVRKPIVDEIKEGDFSASATFSLEYE